MLMRVCAVAPHLLGAGVKGLAEIDIGGAEGGGGVERKRLPVDAEAGVSALVLAEDLEEDLVGMDRDDRIEDDEGESGRSAGARRNRPAGPARCRGWPTPGASGM